MEERPEPEAIIRDTASLPARVRTLPSDALVVFLSDTHIGGDPGRDIFESPEELTMLLEELAAHDGPVDLVLAGDFFDFLQIGEAPSGENRASATISRPEYRGLFSALRSFAGGEDRRVVYLPGNHDAEVWWNGEIRRTLRGEGLVDEFAFSYAARFESVPDRLVYCEHGNQFDPANTIKDYGDPLDTPFGDHVVTDVVRRVVTGGRITRSFDLREVNKVFPLATIPEWIAGRVFYDLLGRMATRLLLPLLAGYAVYRILAYLLAVSSEGSLSFWKSYRTLPGVQVVFGEIAWDALLLATVFVLFFLAIRRTAARLGSSFTAPPAEERPGEVRDSVEKTRTVLLSEVHPPMGRGIRGREIDVFVSGHTHVPSLSELRRENGSGAVVVNSGCWLRQLRPIPARLGGPPVFVPKFVQTHARVYLQDTEVRAELWEHPKPAPRRLRPVERLAILGRLPEQPDTGAKPRISARAGLSKSR
ncbi:metallophosphoesterase [Rubrobacter tropicus]|uniref:metallophosphoesterase n=1 Tax=Rubrobacter tropicus TaxID=2653851 RepID=UPI00140AE5A2|nr:metallophosphoesterase [Rubrobacter tropicus]